MTWADFYLICFAVGFAFSFLSFFLGGLHMPHVPHLHVGPHVHLGDGAGHGLAAGGEDGHSTNSISPFNLVTLAAFLAWFGGTGYLLTRFSAVWFGAGLIIALLTGVAGAGIIYAFLSKVLISREENLDPADYDMVGVLGRLSMPIREGGTGELIYSQAGTRRTCGARSEASNAVEKGTEVVVTRYDRGIAYVRPWSEVAGEEGLSDAASNKVE
jgi:membrane protein implicated in regulation of membrane protease activity